jgi:hypothetical protein
VLVLLHGEGLEAVLVDVSGAGAVVVGVPALRVELPVVGHHAIGQQAHRHLIEGFTKDPLEGLVVAVLVKNGGAGVASVEDVVDEAGLHSARWSWHGHTVTTRAADVNNLPGEL